MKGYNRWNYRPYIPADRRRDLPYICRIAPSEHEISFDWIDDGKLTVYLRDAGCDEWKNMGEFTSTCTLTSLESNHEYEICIENALGVKSVARKVRTGFVPGTVVNYLHPKDHCYDFSGQYLCSPSIIRLENGSLLASMDVHARAPQNLMIIFRSDDDGETWYYVTELFPSFWGKMFLHNGALYMISVSNEYGDVLIGRSDDDGYTWTTPTPLMRGSAARAECGFHRAPCIVTVGNGRIWTAIEYGSWDKMRFSSSIMSAPVDCDLLDVDNWTFTDFLCTKDGDIAGGIEGNAIFAPDGELYNILRYDINKALVLKADKNDPDKQLVKTGFIDFPMAHTKFEIMQHDSGKYYAIGNRPPMRNVLSVYSSDDLVNWEFVGDVLNYEHMDMQYTAFQYPAAFLEGDMMYILSRTAFNEPHNFHDSNFSTFHKVNIKEL